MYINDYGTYVRLEAGKEAVISAGFSGKTLFDIDAKDFNIKFFKEFCAKTSFTEEHYELRIIHGRMILHWVTFTPGLIEGSDSAPYYILGKLKDVYK